MAASHSGKTASRPVCLARWGVRTRESARGGIVGSMEDVKTFPYNRGLGCYESVVEIGGAPVSVQVYDAAISDGSVLNARLSAAVQIVSTRHEELVSAIVAELLDIKNDGWVDGPDEMVTAEQFRSNLSVNAVSVLADGKFEVVWADCDMFWGHAIVVWLDETGRITRVDIEG